MNKLQHSINDEVQGYKLIKQLGKGSFGEVFQAIKLDTGETYALKVIYSNKYLQYKDRFDMECEIGKKILLTIKQNQNDNDAQYLVKQVDQFIMNDSLYMIQEYIEDSLDLDKYIKQIRPSFAGKGNYEYEIFCLKLIYQVLCGLRFLQNKCRICHRDIKPQNILYDKKSGIIKIIDYGLGKLAMQDDGQDNLRISQIRGVSILGTPLFMSPELLQSKSQYQLCKVDVWAVGVTLYQLVKQSQIFQGQNQHQVLQDIKKKIQTEKFQFINKEDFLDCTKSILKLLLAFEENNRCDLITIFQYEPFSVFERGEEFYATSFDKLNSKFVKDIHFISDKMISEFDFINGNFLIPQNDPQFQDKLNQEIVIQEMPQQKIKVNNVGQIYKMMYYQFNILQQLLTESTNQSGLLYYFSQMKNNQTSIQIGKYHLVTATCLYYTFRFISLLYEGLEKFQVQGSQFEDIYSKQGHSLFQFFFANYDKEELVDYANMFLNQDLIEMNQYHLIYQANKSTYEMFAKQVCAADIENGIEDVFKEFIEQIQSKKLKENLEMLHQQSNTQILYNPELIHEIIIYMYANIVHLIKLNEQMLQYYGAIKPQTIQLLDLQDQISFIKSETKILMVNFLSLKFFLVPQNKKTSENMSEFKKKVQLFTDLSKEQTNQNITELFMKNMSQSIIKIMNV